MTLVACSGVSVQRAALSWCHSRTPREALSESVAPPGNAAKDFGSTKQGPSNVAEVVRLLASRRVVRSLTNSATEILNGVALRGCKFFVEQAARLFVFSEEQAGEPPTLRKTHTPSDLNDQTQRAFAQ